MCDKSINDILRSARCPFISFFHHRTSEAHKIALSMALKRFGQTIDGTIPIQALLYEDEQLLGSQDNVGIYDG